MPATWCQPARVLVIAEIGVNHDGDVGRAIELTQAAAGAGADAIKLQLFDPRYLLSNQAVLADYQRRQQENDVFQMLDRLKLSLEDMLAIRTAARKLGLGFVVTPFSLENFEALQALDVDAVKIASPDAVNLPLLSLTASLGKPMIVSTGTAELEELEPGVGIISDRPACLLHCVSSYPTPLTQATLGAIGAMAERYGLPVGYSDHTTEIVAGALAVAAGACVIEKHLTYDRSATGPDHAASFDPAMFRRYAELVRQAATMLGPRLKQVNDAEREVRAICRQSVCARRDLPAGHVLEPGDLTVRRPGTGIPAARLQDVVGRSLRQPVSASCLIQEDDLAEALDTRDVA